MSQTGELFSNLGEPQLKGQATESVLKSAFVKRGYAVLEPAYDNEPYDFVIDVGEDFLRIQAKTAHETDTGTLQFETVSTKARSDGYVRDDYAGDIDFFAVFAPVRETKYLVPIEDSAKGKMELRTEEPKNNQWKGVNWHEDYLLDYMLQTGL